MPHQLAPSIVAFLTEHVACVEELETLMLLAASAGQWWDAPKASRELRIPAARARDALDALAGRNLLDIRITADLRYRFQPGTRELEDAASGLADAYRSDSAAVVQFVAGFATRSHANPADASRLRSR